VSAHARTHEKGCRRRHGRTPGNSRRRERLSVEPEAIRVVRGIVRAGRGEHARGAGRRRGARRRHRLG
jgi:hypothetical protein